MMKLVGQTGKRGKRAYHHDHFPHIPTSPFFSPIPHQSAGMNTLKLIMNSVAALAVIAFGYAVAQPVLEENYRLRNDRLCTSVDCLRVAYEVKRSLNFSVDPCDNFYKFTCGGFEEDTRYYLNDTTNLTAGS